MLSLAATPLAACQTQTGAAGDEQSVSGLKQTPLTIRTAKGAEHKFTVEIAASPAEQNQGLMNRQSLAPDRGMIFPLSPEREASFWMKNTLIPLDMLFVRRDGTIARIEANTVPLELQPVLSGEVVALVLELAGGRAAQLGIQAGDRVSYQGFPATR